MEIMAQRRVEALLGLAASIAPKRDRNIKDIAGLFFLIT